ncbi:MAG: helix-turn-helix domain-containing protein [Betaproteobacteria bacterium]|nr:helix-turn-helix transcriptional regulator [Betaproteobacteria bacterium]MDE2151720.1 helix-turn-helix domain-containing protein [Betaproteobacteria bacterium]
MPSPENEPQPEASGAAEQLGTFLRAARERLQPEALGLPAGRRRRTRGLRREEVAALCGISPTWYTWIEQGRTQAVSVATLDALAQGLRLSPAERSYLFGLARRADPRAAPAARQPAGEPEDQDCARLVGLMRCPAYALDAHWDLLACNPEARRLFAPWLGESGPAEPNLLRWVYLDPPARDWIVDWELRARRLAAEFRADTAALRDDPRHRRFVATLCLQSPEFEQAWRSQQVLEREGGLRAFATAQGLRNYRQFTLRGGAAGAVKLIALQAL